MGEHIRTWRTFSQKQNTSLPSNTRWSYSKTDLYYSLPLDRSFCFVSGYEYERRRAPHLLQIMKRVLLFTHSARYLQAFVGLPVVSHDETKTPPPATTWNIRTVRPRKIFGKQIFWFTFVSRISKPIRRSYKEMIPKTHERRFYPKHYIGSHLQSTLQRIGYSIPYTRHSFLRKLTEVRQKISQHTFYIPSRKRT